MHTHMHIHTYIQCSLAFHHCGNCIIEMTIVFHWSSSRYLGNKNTMTLRWSLFLERCHFISQGWKLLVVTGGLGMKILIVTVDRDRPRRWLFLSSISFAFLIFFLDYFLTHAWKIFGQLRCVVQKEFVSFKSYCAHARICVCASVCACTRVYAHMCMSVW